MHKTGTRFAPYPSCDAVIRRGPCSGVEALVVAVFQLSPILSSNFTPEAYNPPFPG